MKYPESKQKDESQEDFVRRISKFPTLRPFTIMRVVFPTKNRTKLEYIKDWARPVFPEAFPQTDWNGHTTFFPGKISTKEFAKWVAEENIFEAWIGLGEEVSSSAKLFIERAFGKTDNPAKHSAKTKANQSRWAERDKQKEAVRKIAKRLWEKDNTLTIADITRHDEINIIKKSDGKNYSEGTLRDWTKDLAPSNKPGRREKN